MQNEIKITYLGLINKKFRYSIELNGHTFDYFTGLGHYIITKTNPNKDQYFCIDSKELGIWSKEMNKLIPNYNERLYRKHPSKDDVLESLLLDKECGEISFYEFCDYLGYNRDSIEALNIHLECQKIADKLKNCKLLKEYKEKRDELNI